MFGTIRVTCIFGLLFSLSHVSSGILLKSTVSIHVSVLYVYWRWFVLNLFAWPFVFVAQFQQLYRNFCKWYVLAVKGRERFKSIQFYTEASYRQGKEERGWKGEEGEKKGQRKAGFMTRTKHSRFTLTCTRKYRVRSLCVTCCVCVCVYLCELVCCLSILVQVDWSRGIGQSDFSSLCLFTPCYVVSWLLLGFFLAVGWFFSFIPCSTLLLAGVKLFCPWSWWCQWC